jgi:hypothetical protein
MKDHMLSISKLLRRRTDNTLKEVREITGKMAEEAKHPVKLHWIAGITILATRS